MFTRVAVYEIPGHRVEEAVVSFGKAIDAIREMNPVEIYMLISRESDRAVTMTFWDGYGAMEASRVKSSRLRSDAANTVDGSVQSVVEYEVAIHERFHP